MATGAHVPFRLPPDVTVTRETLAEGVAYVFRHRQLGLLGRLIATDSSGQQTLLSAEVAGDAADPMTAERRTILEPLVEQLEARLLQQLGQDWPTGTAGLTGPAGRPGPDHMHRWAARDR